MKIKLILCIIFSIYILIIICPGNSYVRIHSNSHMMKKVKYPEKKMILFGRCIFLTLENGITGSSE